MPGSESMHFSFFQHHHSWEWHWPTWAPLWGEDTGVLAMTEGTSPPLWTRVKLHARLDRCITEKQKASVSGELLSSFPSQIFLNPQCCSQLLGLLTIPKTPAQLWMAIAFVSRPCAKLPGGFGQPWHPLLHAHPGRTDSIQCPAGTNLWGLSRRSSQHLTLHGIFEGSGYCFWSFTIKRNEEKSSCFPYVSGIEVSGL